jgi:hypothetical protein
MPLLRHNRPRCMFTSATSNSVETGDNSNTRFLYESLEGVERLGGYRPGGYHPIKIGAHFHNRYRVVYKLGYGSYSTI